MDYNRNYISNTQQPKTKKFYFIIVYNSNLITKISNHFKFLSRKAKDFLFYVRISLGDRLL